MRYLKKVFSIFLALVLSITMLSSYVMTLKADNNVINLNELEPFKGRTKEEVTEKYDIAKKDEYYNRGNNDYYEIIPSLVAPYDGGKLKTEVHQAMTDLTNFYRWLAGVNPYENISSHDQNLQNFAVIETLYFNATGSLNHYPGSSNLWSKPNDMSDEFWQSAFAPNNIIAYGSSPQAAIEQWFEEGYNQRQNAFNTTGHRDMLLSYQTTGMTFAYTDRMAIGRQLGGGTMNLPCTAYPAPGPYPNISLNPEETAWSIELNDQQLSYDNINDITIKVTNLTTNESYECTAKNNKLTTVSYGYGFAFAQPKVNTDTYVDSYKIEILGLKDLNKNDKIVTYQTDLFDPATMLSSNVVKVDYAWTKVHDSLWNENSVDENDIFGVMPTEITFETDNGRKELLEVGWQYKSSGLGEKWMNVTWYFLPENVNDPQNLIGDFEVYFDRIRNTDSDKNLRYMVTENETLTMKVTPYKNWPIDEYNWYKSQDNGDPILIAQTSKPTFTIENVTKEDAGKYFVIYRITNDVYRNTFITPYKTVTVKEPLALDHLEVTSTKTKYVIGQDFDPENLDITAYYNDDSSKKLNYNDVTITGFDSSSLGEKTITVTYKEDNKTVSTTFKIEIIEKEVKDIVLTPPTKVKYVEGQSLDLTGGKVIVSYNDDTSEEIDLTSDMISGYDKDHLGKQTIIVTYQGKTATFEVEVIKKEATKIELVTLPDKVEYIRGQKLDPDGARIKVTYNDGDTKLIDVTEKMCSGFDSSLLGQKIVTITYENKTTTFEVNIIERVITSIKVDGIVKTKYVEGQSLDLTGGKVIVSYNDDTSEEIDLTSDMISGYDKDHLGKQTIIVTYQGKTATFEVEVIKKEATKIELVTLPDKVEYIRGQKLDPDGARIKVTYNDGDTKLIDVTEKMCSGFDSSSLGQKTVTITYENKTVSFTVNVVERILTLITTDGAIKTEYIEGQPLDISNLKVIALYNDGTSEVIDASMDMISGYDANVIGKQTITVTYKGKTTTFEINVKAKSVTKIEVTSPNKLEYIEGQGLDLSGGKVKVFYDNGTSEEISLTDDMISGYDASIVGKQTITVTYKGKTATFEINVKAKSVTKIEVTSPNKLEYIEGQGLDLSGGKVKVFYDNGTSEEISLTDDMISGYDASIVGKQTIIVTYQGKTATFDVNVIEKVITKIEMNSLPNKVNYLVDQKFEINGATIEVYYNDGSEEIVNVDSNMFNVPNMSKIGNQTIIVNYGGLTTSFEILINDKTLVNISVSTLPDKTEYIEGQGLDVTGGKLLLTYDNGSSEIIDITLAMCSVDMSKPGQVNVSVTYNGFTVTYPILIKEKTPVSLIWVEKPEIRQIKEGMEFIYSGEVKIVYDNGSEEIKKVTALDFEVRGFDKYHIGKQNVIIVYKGTELSVDDTIEVIAKKLSGLKIQSLPLKLTYKQGEVFNLDGLKVLANYDNQTTVLISNDDLIISLPDMNKLGKQVIVISYGDFKVEFEIEITAKDTSMDKEDNKDKTNQDKNIAVKTGDNSLTGIYTTIALLSVATYTMLRKKD